MDFNSRIVIYLSDTTLFHNPSNQGSVLPESNYLKTHTSLHAFRKEGLAYVYFITSVESTATLVGSSELPSCIEELQPDPPYWMYRRACLRHLDHWDELGYAYFMMDVSPTYCYTYSIPYNLIVVPPKINKASVKNLLAMV